MKAMLCAAMVCSLMVAPAAAQNAEGNLRSRHSAQAGPRTSEDRPKPDSGDIEQLRADLQRLKVLLNQMRTNLAFVQATQTPLKHQFELETDAWQVIVEQMERRLKRMEERGAQGKSAQ